MKTKEQVWTLAHKPVTADELHSLRDRLLKDAQEQGEEAHANNKGLPMSYTMRHRTALDLDHLARLLDSDTGTHRLAFSVTLKEKAKPKTAKRAVKR